MALYVAVMPNKFYKFISSLRQSAIFVLLLLAFTQFCNFASASSLNQIYIVDLWHKKHSKNIPASGLLSIGFANQGAISSTIRLVAPKLWDYGLKHVTKNLKNDPTQIDALICNNEVATAKLNYRWKDKNGSTVISDSAEFDQRELVLLPGKSLIESISIRIPEQPGLYNLEIQFDNTNVQAFSETSAHRAKNEVFLTADTHKQILIPDKD